MSYISLLPEDLNREICKRQHAEKLVKLHTELKEITHEIESCPDNQINYTSFACYVRMLNGLPDIHWYPYIKTFDDYYYDELPEYPLAWGWYRFSSIQKAKSEAIKRREQLVD
jgi:hypothetical protein